MFPSAWLIACAERVHLRRLRFARTITRRRRGCCVRSLVPTPGSNSPVLAGFALRCAVAPHAAATRARSDRCDLAGLHGQPVIGH